MDPPGPPIHAHWVTALKLVLLVMVLLLSVGAGVWVMVQLLPSTVWLPLAVLLPAAVDVVFLQVALVGAVVVLAVLVVVLAVLVVVLAKVVEEWGVVPDLLSRS